MDFETWTDKNGTKWKVADKKRLEEINDLLYQIENVLRWSGK